MISGEREKIKRLINNMGGDNYFLEKIKKPIRDDDQRLLASFQGNISVVDLDHQLKFSNDGCRDDDHSFVPKGDETDDGGGEPAGNEPQERRIYWESQEFLLQEILDQCNSTGSNLREQIKRNIDIARDTNFCSCLDKNHSGCTKCLRQAAVKQLCSKGFDAALCTSKWKRTHKIPGGTHEYIEVIACTQGRRKQIPFLVELGFRDEFRMAKACDEYNKLINQLPEIYTGKVEHLNAIIRVVCEAAKKSAKEKKIHMGPWRKRNFMQMKWSASSERRFHDHSSNELMINSSRQGSLNAVRSSFQLPMASTVKVA
ncbi:hypothetical protein Pfo_020950 [Paulownia fortunei]|nr:hypothetical protein Pfo_020950 [Paulownia fortunei]